MRHLIIMCFKRSTLEGKCLAIEMKKKSKWIRTNEENSTTAWCSSHQFRSSALDQLFDVESRSVPVCFSRFHNTTTHNTQDLIAGLQKCHWRAKSDLISLLVNNLFLPQSKMLRQISLMRLTLPPSRKIILNKTSQKYVSLRSISTRAQYAAYFKTLDLPISATKEQVRRRYIELAKQHHPDAGESSQLGCENRLLSWAKI